MYDRLVPGAVFPLYERLTGRRLWTEVLHLRELQWHSPEEMAARTFQKLRPLLKQAATNVPFYRDLFQAAGIQPEDLRDTSDLSRLPITTKADLRSGFPERTTAENLPAWRRWKMTTSGSSGFLFEFYNDRAGTDSWISSYLFFLEWAGAALWKTQIFLSDPSSRTYRAKLPCSPWITPGMRRLLLGERVIHLPGEQVTPALLRDQIRGLSSGGSYFIRGNPSYIAHLAAQLLAEGRDLQAYPRVVITGGETLTAPNAAIIQSAFRCPVVDHYSTWEVPHIAQTCPDNPGMLHVNSERVILRIVRDDGTPAAPGERGRVVITSLTNYVMPFINYELGDWAVASAPCACGRGLPSFATLDGRLGEMIRTPSGKAFATTSLTRFVTHGRQAVPYIWEYQAVQTAPDTVIFRLVPTSLYTAEFARELKSGLEHLLGPDLSVRIETVDRIPTEPSGKRLIIKSYLAHSGGSLMR